jgi:isopenicillin N synthase-like dioxygenase
MSTAADIHGRLLAVFCGQIAMIAHRIAPSYPERLAAFLRRAPAPVLRITFYPSDSGREIANYPHKDIDLITLLPRATEPGLQMALQAGWREIQIDADSVIVLSGEMLELLGGPPAELHRVVGSKERISASFFVNASPDELLPNGAKAGAVLKNRLKMMNGTREQI